MSLIPQKLRIPKRKRDEIEERFQRDGVLTARKLREYVPVMLVNNLSVLLLITVDGYGYAHLFEVFLPMLKDRGITDDDIDLMLDETPRRIFMD